MSFRSPKHCFSVLYMLLGLFYCTTAFSSHDINSNLETSKGIKRSSSLISLSPDTNSVSLSKNSHVFEDKSNKLNHKDIINRLDEIEWSQTTKHINSHGFVNSTYWYLISIDSLIENPGLWYLEYSFPLTDTFDVFIIRDGKLQEEYYLGDSKPFQSRPFKHRNYIVPINILPQEKILILFAVRSSDESIFATTLWSNPAFIEHNNTYTLGYGLYYGIMLIMIVYNFFIFLTTRDTSYLIYVLFVSVAAMFTSVQQGYAIQYFWPDNTRWANLSDPVISLLACSISTFFTISFLNLKKHFHAAYVFSSGYAVSCLLLIPIWFFVPLRIAIFTTITLTLIGMLNIFMTSIIRAYKGDSVDRVFLLAWSCLITGGFILILSVVGILPKNILSHNGFLIGHSLEVAILSFALGLRYKEIERKEIEAISENQSKSEFLAKMSHEIRTPLNGILGISELLKYTDLNAEQKRYNDVIHSSGLSLLGLINDLLDYSKIDAGKMELETIPFELQKVIDNTISLLDSQIREKSITILVSIDPSVSPYLIGDPSRLKQVLMNLIGNAVKFTEKGKVDVTVTSVDKQNSDLIKFSVLDTGMGINKENQQKLFSNFSQAESDTSRRFGGTGLGLSISKQLAELMGGEIGFTSEYGKGSTFWFTAKFESLDDNPSQSDEVYASLSGQRYKILLVEDNETNRFLVINMLKKMGHTCLTANDGVEAVEILSDEKSDFDLVLMDYEMPKMNGLEAARAIRNLENKNNRLPIVALTAHAVKSIIDQCYAAGMNNHLSKPIEIKKLAQAIDSTIGDAVT